MLRSLFLQQFPEWRRQRSDDLCSRVPSRKRIPKPVDHVRRRTEEVVPQTHRNADLEKAGHQLRPRDSLGTVSRRVVVRAS